jgi:DNA-directed RNA polymerase subunit RPC12/RpoP
MAGAGYVVICLFFGLAGGFVGRMKGSSFVLWFMISALIPFFGLLAAIFYRWEDRELRRRCPDCGRVVKLHDAKCMRCGAELEFPEAALPSEAMVRRAKVRERAGAANT